MEPWNRVQFLFSAQRAEAFPSHWHGCRQRNDNVERYGATAECLCIFECQMREAPASQSNSAPTIFFWPTSEIARHIELMARTSERDQRCSQW